MTDSPRPETLAVHPPRVEVTGSRPLGVPPPPGTRLRLRLGRGPRRGLHLAGRLPLRPPRQPHRPHPGGRRRPPGGRDRRALLASGMGAINAVLLGLLGSGGHVIAETCLYGGTYAVLSDLAARWGVDVTYVSGTDPEEVRAALRPETRLLYLETIANPTTRVADLPGLDAVAAEAGVPVAVDNTFALTRCSAAPSTTAPTSSSPPPPSTSPGTRTSSAASPSSRTPSCTGRSAATRSNRARPPTRSPPGSPCAACRPCPCASSASPRAPPSWRPPRSAPGGRGGSPPGAREARPDRAIAARLLPAGGGGVVRSTSRAAGRRAAPSSRRYGWPPSASPSAT
ncbi:aminotransferase class I/II-fold pyridoxal phosphate-dependent enzyme [Streptomyces tanashiensis]